MGRWPEHRVVRIILKDGLPLRDKDRKDWPYFEIVRTDDGSSCKVTNPANLDEMIKWAKDIEGEDAEIIVWHYDKNNPI